MSGLWQIFFTPPPRSSLFSLGNLLIERIVKEFGNALVESMSIDRHELTDVHSAAKTEFLGFDGCIMSSFFFRQPMKVPFD